MEDQVVVYWLLPVSGILQSSHEYSKIEKVNNNNNNVLVGSSTHSPKWFSGRSYNIKLK